LRIRGHSLWPHLIVGFLLASLGLTAQQVNSEYLPLSSNEVGQPFTLKALGLIKADSSPLTSRAGPTGSTFRIQRTADFAALTLEGKDKGGKPWTIDTLELWGCEGGTRVYEADLDADTVQDAVLLTPTCGNGLAPRTHMIAITFDASGRPVPFEAEGYFEDTRPGIDSLVDMNHDGKADLIFMNFNDGYWITNVYSVKNGRWARMQGNLHGRAFPLYTRFTNQPNHRAVIPPSSRHPWASDLSNATPVLAGVIIERKWPDENLPSDPSDRSLQLTILSGAQKVICTPDYWFDTAKLVQDQAERRTIQRLSIDERSTADAMLQELIARKVPVRLYGRRMSDRCSPELVWAGQD